MRICNFCGAENFTEVNEKRAEEACYNCGNNLGDKRFKEPDSVKADLTSKQPSNIFPAFFWIIIIPIGFLFGILMLYVTYASWRP